MLSISHKFSFIRHLNWFSILFINSTPSLKLPKAYVHLFVYFAEPNPSRKLDQKTDTVSILIHGANKNKRVIPTRFTLERKYPIIHHYYCWWFRNPANHLLSMEGPLEKMVESFPHINWWSPDFWTIKLHQALGIIHHSPPFLPSHFKLA